MILVEYCSPKCTSLISSIQRHIKVLKLEWLHFAICLLHSIFGYWLVLTRSAKYWLVFLLHHLNNQFFFTKVFFVFVFFSREHENLHSYYCHSSWPLRSIIPPSVLPWNNSQLGTIFQGIAHINLKAFDYFCKTNYPRCLAGFWTRLWNWWQVKTKLFLPKNYFDTTNFRQERLKESLLSICVFLYHHWWFQDSREKVWASTLPSTSRMLPNYLCCYGTQFL